MDLKPEQIPLFSGEKEVTNFTHKLKLFNEWEQDLINHTTPVQRNLRTQIFLNQIKEFKKPYGSN